MSKEAMKLALDALENELSVDMTNGAEVGEAAELMCEAIKALREELAKQDMPKIGCVNHDCDKCKERIIQSYLEKDNSQQEQGEPVAWRWFDGNRTAIGIPPAYAFDFEIKPEPLYTTPLQRTWVGLTHEEREKIALEVPMDAVCITEAKLKEKNT
jgi:hypothetical protein